jgi:drug/metabolite transporter (DMT)-like permease
LIKKFRPATGWGPVLVLVMVVFFWASATVVTKHLYQQKLITPYTLVVGRFTVAGVVALLIFYFIRRKLGNPTLPLVGGFKAYLLGGLFITTFIFTFNTGLQFITASLSGVLFFGLCPLFMLLIGYFWLGVKTSWQQGAGVALSLVGILIVVSNGDPLNLISHASGSNPLLGMGLMTLAAIGWSAYGLWGKRYTSRAAGASLLSTGFNQLLGVAPIWILALAFEPTGFLSLNLEAWIAIIYVGIVPSAIGFALFYWVIPRLPLEQVATIQLFSPVFTEVMAILWLGELFSLALVLGTAILLVGVRIASTPPKFSRIGTTGLKTRV